MRWAFTNGLLCFACFFGERSRLVMGSTKLISKHFKYFKFTSTQMQEEQKFQFSCMFLQINHNEMTAMVGSGLKFEVRSMNSYSPGTPVIRLIKGRGSPSFGTDAKVSISIFRWIDSLY
jgi:hypothetical protein